MRSNVINENILISTPEHLVKVWVIVTCALGSKKKRKKKIVLTCHNLGTPLLFGCEKKIRLSCKVGEPLHLDYFYIHILLDINLGRASFVSTRRSCGFDFSVHEDRLGEARGSCPFIKT